MTRGSLNVIDLDSRDRVSWRRRLPDGARVRRPAGDLASRSSVTTCARFAIAVRDGLDRGAPHSRVARGGRDGAVDHLLVGAALMTRSLLKLQAIDIGMDPRGLIATTLAFPARGYEDAGAGSRHYGSPHPRPPRSRRAGGERRRPAAARVDDHRWSAAVRRSAGPEDQSTLLSVFDTWPGYFAATGIRLIEGREPIEHDIEGAAVVSAGFAAKHWLGLIGARRHHRRNHPTRTIVGVASEVRRMAENDDSAQFEVLPRHDQVSGVMTAAQRASQIAEFRKILVRSPRPAVLARRLATIVHDVDPRIVVSSTSLVAHEVADAIARPRVVFLMMAIFAGVGLALAAAGLYGVLSYLVNQRRREIGIRLALGASPREIGRLFLRSGLGLATLGLRSAGAAAALVSVMRTLLHSRSRGSGGGDGGDRLDATAPRPRGIGAARRVDPVALLGVMMLTCCCGAAAIPVVPSNAANEAPLWARGAATSPNRPAEARQRRRDPPRAPSRSASKARDDRARGVRSPDHA
jgi:hypothetical protein